VSDTAKADVPCLPWRAAGLALVSFGCLGGAIAAWPILIPLVFLLLAHYLLRFRLPESPWLLWPVRLAFFAAVFALHFSRPNDFIDFGAPWGGYTSLVGELAAVELVFQTWRRRPSGGTRGEAVVFLSGIVLIAGFNVYIRDTWPQYVAPLYFVLLAFHLRAMRARTDRVSSVGAVLALVFVLPGGVAISYSLASSRAFLTRLDMSFLNWLEPKGTDLSDSPTLGKGPGGGSRMERVLLVDGPLPEQHLRGMTFDEYRQGTWRPPLGERLLRVATRRDLRAEATGPRTRIRRLNERQRSVFAPLHAEGVLTVSDVEVTWDVSGGCDLAVYKPEGMSWVVATSPEPNHQGPLCRPPDGALRERYLAIPREVRPSVRELALRIGGGLQTPMEQVHAVEQYFLTNHEYGLDVDPGQGDPVSNFLERKLSAHCEYFASGATMLLRHLGIPTRYVVGYYAHEDSGDGRIVVRARDAHAWAESWIEGVGWVTVEPTPPSGLPDQAEDGPSFFRKAWEAIRDGWSALVAWLSDLTWEKAGILVLGALLLVLFVRVCIVALRRFRARKRRERAFGYAGSDGAFGELARRFERALKRRGRPCPTGRTWREHCDGEAALLTFVAAYEAARFGGQGEGQAVGALSERLREIERSRHEGVKA